MPARARIRPAPGQDSETPSPPPARARPRRLADALLAVAALVCAGACAERAPSADPATAIDSRLLALAADPAAISAGREIFRVSCALCHGAEGEGLLGPNLTDRYWISGARPSDLLRAVEQGSPERGMPPWREALGPERSEQVTAFVLTLAGRELDGKAPQGELAR